MMKINDKQTPNTVFVPLLIALALVVGIFIGSRFASKKTIDLDRKINNILGIVADAVRSLTRVSGSIPVVCRTLAARAGPMP